MTAGLKPSVRLFMVDDHPAVRQGLRLLLEQEGMSICGEASDASSALEDIARTAPDVVMVDLSLGRESGLDILRTLKDAGCRSPLLVYSMHEDAFHIQQALASGAFGYVTKRELPGVLTLAIRKVLTGEQYLSPKSRSVLETVSRGTGGMALSDRELKVYQYLGRGYSTVGIAQELGVSRRTVDTYYVRIMSKLRLHGMDELRRHAVANREAN